jgi:hypothetical protein
MEPIRIEEVGDINFRFPYMEAFIGKSFNPFLDIGVTKDKNLAFKFYASKKDVVLSIEDLERIVVLSKEFSKRVLTDEKYYL